SNTPSPTVSATPTSSFTTTSTSTQTSTPTSTQTWTSSATATFTQTSTSTATATMTPTATRTSTPSATPTETFTSTPTATLTFTPTFTYTLTRTPTPTPVTGVVLSKQVSETTAQSGDLLTYSLQMNVTGNNASSVVVTDILPPNVTFTGFVSDPAGSTAQYNSAVSLLTWTLPSPLPPGTYSFVYQTKVNDFVKGGSVLTNNAKASYSGGPAATASV